MNILQNNVCFFFWNSITVLADSACSPSQFPIHSLHYCCQAVILHLMLCIWFILCLLLHLQNYMQLISGYFFNEFWIPICLSKKGFRSISRLSSSRCFISILIAPLNCENCPQGDGRTCWTPSEPAPLSGNKPLVAECWAFCFEQIYTGLLFLPH